MVIKHTAKGGGGVTWAEAEQAQEEPGRSWGRNTAEHRRASVMEPEEEEE